MSRSTSIARIAVLILAGSLAACSKSLDNDKLQKIIADGVSSQTGMKTTTVSCPADRPIKAGDSFDCTATPEMGGKLTIKVTQKDTDGNVNWELTNVEGVLALDKVEASIKSGLLEQAKVDATVSCGGGKWRASKPGDVFDCTATDPAGKAVMVAVTVNDANGNINWKLK